MNREGALETSRTYRIFDGHNDLLSRRVGVSPTAVSGFFEGYGDGHLDLPRMQAGGFAGGMFATFAPGEGMVAGGSVGSVPELGSAQVSVFAMVDLLDVLVAKSNGTIRLCRTAGQLRDAIAAGEIAAVLHLEGAEPIDAEFAALETLYARGLRSLGPVWARTNLFGHGVPPAFPSSPDIGPGLTDLGKELVKRCNGLGILIDLSHLNEKGFWDVAALSKAPLVATHSCAHRLVPHSRNLTDTQLGAVAQSGGLVGLNFGSVFVRGDGRRDPETPLSALLDHLDHMIAVMGDDHVGLGSDYDGTVVPEGVSDVSKLPNLIEAMHVRGYEDRRIRKLCTDNWLRVLEKTWGS